MITNDGGFVLVRHYNSNPSTIRVGENSYSFIPEWGVSLAWVRPEDLGAVLAIKAALCCGKNQNKFWEANQNDFNVWTKGSY
jgi:hypothetical protein